MIKEDSLLQICDTEIESRNSSIFEHVLRVTNSPSRIKKFYVIDILC